MFGPSARTSPSSLRRARRRLALGLAVAGLVALLIGEVVNDIVNSGPAAHTRAVRSWVAAISPIAASSAALAPTIESVRRNPVSLGRAGLNEALGEIEAESAANAADYADLRLAAPRPLAAAAFSAALAARASTAALLAEGVEDATGTDAAGASSALARAGSELLAGDEDYRQMLADLGGYGAYLSRSQWSTKTSASLWHAAALVSYATTLHSSLGLRVRPGLVVLAVSVVPPPVSISGLPPATTTTTTSTTTTTLADGTTTTLAGSTTSTSTSTSTTSTSTPPTSTLQVPPGASISVLVPVRSLRVRVLVENSGDNPLSGVDVSVALTPGVPAQTIDLGVLAPGSTRYVVLGPFAVHTGKSYALGVHASAPGAKADATVRLRVSA